jgi:hydroxysqualene synthase
MSFIIDNIAMNMAAHGVEHYENFPVASWLTPARLRPAIVAIYWFARVADDLADEGTASSAQRLADLAAYRADLDSLYTQGQPSSRWPQVFEPLKLAVQQHQLPAQLLADLLSAFEQDVRYTAVGRWYATEAELHDYCRRSANPVGRLLLHLYGVHAASALQASDAICTALQLINFWQDLSKDIPRGRYYSSEQRMTEFAVQKTDILNLQDQADTINLIANYVINTTALMQKGFNLPAEVRNAVKGLDGWRLSLELRCVIQGGLRIAHKIQAMNHQTLNARPKLGAWDGVVIVCKALWM